jgi:hypothetical protein
MFGTFLPTSTAVVSRCCQKRPTRTPSRLPVLRLHLTYAEYGRVTAGARTRALRSHNPTTLVSGRCQALQNRLI